MTKDGSPSSGWCVRVEPPCGREVSIQVLSWSQLCVICVLLVPYCDCGFSLYNGLHINENNTRGCDHVVGTLAINPDSSGGGCCVLKQSSFMWVSADPVGILHKSHLGCAAQMLTSFQPGFLSTLLSPTVCSLPHKGFMEQAEHGVTWCLHMSLTSPLVAPDKSAGLLGVELSVTPKINGCSFCIHC